MGRLLLIGVSALALYLIWRIASVRLKQGASLENVSWRMFYAAIIADGIFKARGAEAVITSGSDGKHSRQSKHYAENNASGLVEALDFRSREVADPEQVRNELAEALGPDYDVVLESDHIHVEYDPETA